MFRRHSIVFRIAFNSALICALACSIVFVGLYQIQKNIYESKLVSDFEQNVSRTTNAVLGHFYGQGNWVYLEYYQKQLKKIPNLLYTYIVNKNGVIDVGLNGLQSDDIGKEQLPWEPELNTRHTEIEKFPFVVSQQLQKRFPDRVNTGHRAVLISVPIQCMTSGETCAYVRVAIIFDSIKATLANLKATLIFAGIILTILTALAAFFTARRHLLPIRRVSEHMRTLASQDAVTPLNAKIEKNDAIETKQFKRSINLFTTAIQRNVELESQLKTSRSLADQAAQVAHDIRSPLAALEMVTSTLPQMPETTRIILRGALSRIRDIANNLLTQNISAIKIGASDETPSLTSEARTTQSVASLVDSLVSEKRVQYRSLMHVEIDLPKMEYGLFVSIQTAQFKRALSNLIDNAVESFVGTGKVTVSSYAEAKMNIIEVTDNGKGIAPKKLSQVVKKGITFGKSKGSGLGLFQAKQSVERWGGSLHIDSRLGSGTTVQMHLPQVAPPCWFVPNIELASKTRIIILDDDASIHQIWSRRFESLAQSDAQITIAHCSTIDQLMEQHALPLQYPRLYLLDYELLGSATTGVELIKTLKIKEQAILVTSRADEPKIVGLCESLKLKMIPKGQSALVPIVLVEEKCYDFILVDDDELIRQTWEMIAKQHGKIVRTFDSSHQILAEINSINRKTPTFVDANLKEKERGEQLIEKLLETGFTEVYLASGYDPSQLHPPERTKGVVGKEPPDWLL